MCNINVPRVIAGGIVAGIVINAFEWLSHLAYGDEAMASLAAHNIEVKVGIGIIVVGTLVGILVGIVAVCLYAGVRPRFGPGVKTAGLVGCSLWLVGPVPAVVGYYFLGIYQNSLLIAGTAVALIEYVVATIAGAWVYREE